jgi:LPS sulfotransferase NodH
MTPERTLILASTPRTGSTLLCSVLEDTGLAGHANELLNPIGMVGAGERYPGADLRLSPLWMWPILTGTRAIGRGRYPVRRFGYDRLIRPAGVPPYLRRAQRRTSTPNGVFAINLHWGHWRQATTDWGLTPEDLGPERTWVWLTRRDRLLQAVSMSIAVQSDSWAASMDSKRTPEYDADSIAGYFDGFIESNRAWATWFDRNEITPILAPYEDVVADLVGHVHRVLDSIGVKVDEVPVPRLQKQATSRNTEWVERFLNDRPEFAERRYDTSP